MNFFSKWFQAKEERKKLKLKFKNSREDYATQVRNIAEKAQKLTGLDLAATRTRLDEWQRRYADAKLRAEADLTDGYQLLEQLVKDVQGWTPPTGQPLPNKPVDLKELKTLKERLDKLGKEATDGLQVPKCLTGASGLCANELAKDPLAVTPTDVQTAATAAQGVLQFESEMRGFHYAWSRSKGAQFLSTQKVPPGVNLYTSLHLAWGTDRDKIGVSWKDLDQASDAVSLTQQLSDLDIDYDKKRSDLQTAYDDAIQSHAKHLHIYEELSVSKAKDLAAEKLKLDKVREAIDKAADESQLKSALSELADIKKDLDNARLGIEQLVGKELKAYTELRMKLVECITKAKKLRGANVENSEVKKAVDKLEAALKTADEQLKQALDGTAVEGACLVIRNALKGDPLESARKKSKDLKAQANRDLIAQPEYEKALQAVKNIRQQVSQLPGAHDALQKLDALIVLNLVGPSGSPPGGFDQALKNLTGANPSPEKLLEMALKAKEQFDQDIGKVKGGSVSSLSVEESLVDMAKSHSPLEVEIRRQQLAQLVAKTDPKDLPDKFTQFADATRQLSTDRENVRKQLEERREKCVKSFEDLEILGLRLNDDIGSMIKMELTQLKEVISGPGWEQAARAMDGLDESIKQLSAALNTAINQWNQGQNDRDALKKEAQTTALGWGKAAPYAQRTVVELSRIESRLVKREIDQRQALQEYELVSEGVAASMKQHRASSGLDKVGEQDLQAFKDKSELLHLPPDAKVLQEKKEELRLKIAAIEGELKSKGLKGSSSLNWMQDFGNLSKEWDNLLLNFTPSQTDKPDDALQQQYDDIQRRLTELLNSVPSPGKISVGLITDGKKHESEAECRQIWELADRALLDLESLGAPDVDKKRISIGQAFTMPTTENEIKTKKLQWANLAKAWAKELKELRDKAMRDKEPSIQRAITLQSSVAKRLLDSNSVTFRKMFDELDRRLQDARQMLNTDDPLLVQAGQRAVEEIDLLVQEARGKASKGGVTLERLIKRHTTLSNLLGEKAYVQRRMPQTYARLSTQLIQAWTDARQLPPEQGMDRLLSLQAPITQAHGKAHLLEIEYGKFKLQRKELEGKLGQVQSHTGTTLGDRAKAYNERFESRLNDVQGLAREEGKLEEAKQQLNAMDRELQAFLDMPAPVARQKMLEANATEAQNQRDLRDLARTWNTTETYWNDQLLPEVEKAIKLRDADKSEYKSLRAAVKNIARTLDPYLAVVSRLPGKRGMSNGSPDMKMARSAFSQAFMRLAQLQKAAQRLRDGTGSTNVELEEDLDKLVKEWRARSEALVQSLARLVVELEGLPNGAVTDVGKKDEPNYLPDPMKTELVDAVGSVKGVLVLLSSRLDAEAFAQPLGNLKSGVDEAKRLTARETALRLMRQLKADIVDNTVFTLLFKGIGQGLLKEDLRPPLGLLRASLKKIELAALVSV